MPNWDDFDDDGDGLPDAIDPDADGDGEEDCDCNGHGDCGRLKIGCFCDKGWTGEECDEFTCKDLNDCNGNGFCDGPNQCGCLPGFTGKDCGVFEFDCQVNPLVCDDGNPCTIDLCDSDMGCISKEMECTDDKQCRNGECVDNCTSAADCDVGLACNNGACVECAQDSECDDGDPCTVDTCEADGCVSTDVVCDPGEACVFGTCRKECNANMGCPAGEVCRDGGCHGGCQDDGDCALAEHCDQDACIPDDDDQDGG